MRQKETQKQEALLKIKLSDYTLKDVDLLNLLRVRQIKIDIDKTDIHKILQTIERDASFLRQNKLMDYSLLLGIEKIKPVKGSK